MGCYFQTILPPPFDCLLYLSRFFLEQLLHILSLPATRWPRNTIVQNVVDIDLIKL